MTKQFLLKCLLTTGQISYHLQIKGVLSGILTENEGEYTFSYSQDYLQKEDAKAISLTLPLREEPYVSPVLSPFFDGLIPEGWLLDIASLTKG